MHFYDTNAEPRHFVEMKSRPGELRPTRINDAKKHGWLPSVTTVLNVLGKPALVDWKVDQHIRQAYRLDPKRFMSVDEWREEVKRRTELEMDKAPTAGTNLHNKLELHALWQLDDEDPDYDLCDKVINTVYSKTASMATGWIHPERRFVSDAGYGGCVDLCGDFGGTPWVIDYKTKQTADKFKPGRMAFPDHSRQLAAYRYGLGFPAARCANVFICLETGEVDFHEHKEDQLQKGFATFMDALRIWQRENYDSSIKAEVA